MQRVLSALNPPVTGFITSWGDAEADGTTPLILKDAAGTKSAVAAIRYTDDRPREVFEEVFETLGASCLEHPAGLVLMDEIGRFESSTEQFRSRIFQVLDTDLPILGVVRDMEIPFLDAVRNHPKTEVVRITEENREEMYAYVLRRVEEILA